jgi:hypothetical protein
MKKFLTVLAVILGLVFLYVGYIYASHVGSALPGYFPGYSAGYNHIHTKHSIAAFLLGIACFIFAWFNSGPKQS